MNGRSFIVDYPSMIQPELAEALITTHFLQGTPQLLSRGDLQHTTHFGDQASIVLPKESEVSKGLKNGFMRAIARYQTDVIGGASENFLVDQLEITVQRHYKNGGEPLPFFLDATCDHTIQLGLVAHLGDLQEGGQVAFPFQATVGNDWQGSINVFPLTWSFFNYGPEPKSGDKYLATCYCRLIHTPVGRN